MMLETGMRVWIARLLFSRWWATLLWMAVSAIVFGLLSYNTFMILQADIALVRENGVMALMDGVAVEVIGLGLTGFFSLLSYIVFKACEHSLIGRLTGNHPSSLDRGHGE